MANFRSHIKQKTLASTRENSSFDIPFATHNINKHALKESELTNNIAPGQVLQLEHMNCANNTIEKNNKGDSFYIYLMVMCLDGLAVIASGFLVYMLRFQTLGEPQTLYLIAMVIQSLLVVSLFTGTGIYQSWRGRTLGEQATLLIKAWAMVSMAFIAICFLTKTSSIFSRQWIIYWSVLNLLFFIGIRILVHNALYAYREHGGNLEKIVLVGSVSMAEKVCAKVHNSPGSGFQVIALFTDENTENISSDINVFQDYEQISSICNQLGAKEVWILLPLEKINQYTEIKAVLRDSTVNIRYIPELHGLPILNYSVVNFLGMDVWNISITPITEGNRLIKRLEDIVLSILFLILLAPLFLLIALGVKLSSPGPIIFKQKRHGGDGNIVTIYKFRSMVVHTEKPGTVTQARKNDTRVTRYGSFLRQFNLDELPQFFNVLQGRMSIVGPRPHAVAHNHYYKGLIENYMKRHKVKPGITGWAQVNGWRGETETLDKMKNRVDCDIYYINNWSFWFDLQIILLTSFRCFFGKNAY